MTSFPYQPRRRPCLTCGAITIATDQLCPEHVGKRIVRCVACKGEMRGVSVLRKYCAPCKAERQRQQCRRSKMFGSKTTLPPADHPCLMCGCNVPGRALRCGPCEATARVDYIRERRRRARLGLPLTDKPSKKGPAVAYPCGRCRHGKPSTASETGYECGRQAAGACRPWAEASLMEER